MDVEFSLGLGVMILIKAAKSIASMSQLLSMHSLIPSKVGGFTSCLPPLFFFFFLNSASKRSIEAVFLCSQDALLLSKSG